MSRTCKVLISNCAFSHFIHDVLGLVSSQLMASCSSVACAPGRVVTWRLDGRRSGVWDLTVSGRPVRRTSVPPVRASEASDAGWGPPIEPRLDTVVNTLPIKEVLHRCLDELTGGTSLVLQAPPGAGKTTTLPLAMLLSTPEWLGDDGVILVLEPRRLAARAAANRMASILGEPVGKTVGYKVRFDSKVSSATRIEVVTEGILTRRLQMDPGLENVKAVVFDEFHERSLDADLCLALCTDVRVELRPDLRLVVMSATLGDVGPLTAEMLGGHRVIDGATDDESKTQSSTKMIKKPAPLVASEGRAYPVRTEYLSAPGRGRFDLENSIVAAVKQALEEHPTDDGGDILVFLPGVREIDNCVRALRSNAGSKVKPQNILPLHGSLTKEAQQLALSKTNDDSRRIVVSTPIAESSLTIDGVRIVVDAGLRKTPRFDANKGMTRLQVVKISIASADQRRGRAGRVAPGTCYRLWSEMTHGTLQSDTPPEISNADLAPLALNLANWGGRDLLEDYATNLPWLDPPPKGQMLAAVDLLEKLGAVDMEKGRVTATGVAMNQLPAHPRIARMLLWAATRGPESARLACQLAAVLGERDVLRGRDAPVDVRTRLGALWDAEGKRGANVMGLPIIPVDDMPNDKSEPPSPTTPTRVPIGTKLSGGKKSKKMRGAPRGRPADGGAIAAVKNANASSGEGSPFSAYDSNDIDRNATREAKKVAEQLLRALKRLAQSDTHAGDTFVQGVGEGDPSGPVFPFLLGEGVDESGVLLAMAYPDRIGVKRTRGNGAHKLSSGNGAATVPSTDPISTSEVVAIADLLGDALGSFGGGNSNIGARNDRVKVAGVVPVTALEPGGCLHAHLCATKDFVQWASASNAVVCRRALVVGSATLKESAVSADDCSEEVIEAMLRGIREIGVKEALGWSDDTEQWRKRVIWFREKEIKARLGKEVESDEEEIPDLSDAALEADLEQWLAPSLMGISSKSALRKKVDGNSIIRNMLSWNQTQLIDMSCPAKFKAPSGSNLKIDYNSKSGVPVLSARLQELFGLAESPFVGNTTGGSNRWRVNIEVHLLSPASRPVQVTSDLKSFWEDAYFAVKKDLKGRYPKHFWPEDPTVAEATNRAKPRKEKKK